MSRNKKIIIAFIVLALLLLGVWLLLSRRATSVPAEDQPGNTVNGPRGTLLNTGTTTTVNGASSAAPKPVALVPPKPAAEANLGRLAAAFVERYGSYSNTDNDFANLLDLKVFMSSGMMARTDANIAKQRGLTPAKDHYGITTRAINSTTTSYSDTNGRAEIKVKTQREEFIGNTPNGKVKYQDIDVVFVKEGEVWKVDSATWN